MGDRDLVDANTDQYYYTCESISSDFTILSNNIRSYNKNVSAFTTYLERIANVKIACFQECWNLSGNERLQGFQPFVYATRKGRRGGGVSIAVKQDLPFKQVDAIYIEGVFESVGIKFQHAGESYSLFNIYVPPKTPIATTLEKIAELRSLKSNSKHLILMGDFNINIDCADNNEFLDQMIAWNLPPLFKCHTRVTEKSATSIDLIFTNNSKIQGGAIESSISDHFLLFATMKGKKARPRISEFPDHSERALNILKDYLKCVSFQEVLSTNDETAFIKFENIMTEAKKICCSTISSTKRYKPSQPWYTKGLQISSRVKDKLCRQHRKCRTDESWQKYVTFRRLYYKTCRKAKYLYYRTEFNQNIDNMKKSWSLANELTGRLKHDDDVTSMPNCNGEYEVCQKFNQYFGTIASKLSKTIPKSNTSFKEYMPKLKYSPKFIFKKVTQKDVMWVINDLKNKTSYGYDTYTNVILKHLSDEIIEPLTHLTNLSFSINHFPSSWKCARVLPIYKSGPKDDFGNYRPIGLTSVFGKVIEKLTAKQLTAYMDEHKIWYPNQFGFRSKHSTQDMLLKYYDTIYRAKQKKMHAVSIMVDVRKAFDCIPHKILIAKAAHYGLPADWIASYLEGRQQYVSIGGHNSTRFKLDPIGTGQGAVLSALFFGIFLNDLASNTKLLTICFADDTTFIACSKNYNELFKNIQIELNKIQSWFLSNGLLLHPKKTRFIVYSHNQNCPDLYLSGEKIIQVGEHLKEKTVKLLGIELDNQNSFKYHINKLTHKVQAAVSLIKRSKYYLTGRMRLLLYNALVVSNLNYCSAIWGNSDTQLTKLKIAQKRAIRIVNNSTYNAHTLPIFHKTGALALDHILELNLLKLGNKIVTKQSPFPVRMAFPIKKKSKTRSGDKVLLHVPSTKTYTERKFPKYKLPMIWNNASKNFNINMLTKTETLSNNYKKMMLINYSKFQCKKSKCYSCQKP